MTPRMIVKKRFGTLGIALALLGLVALACGEPEETDNGGGSGGGGAAGHGGGGHGGFGGMGGSGGSDEIVIPTDEFDTGWEPEVPESLDEDLEAEPRPASCGEEFGYVAKLRGWIVAPGGKPLPGAYAQFCIYPAVGQYICLNPAEADEEGVYTVDVPEPYRCVKEVAMRTIKAERNRVVSYCPVTPGEDPVIRLRMPSVLPFAMPPEDLPPVGDADEAREVLLHDGLRLMATPSKFSWGPRKYEELAGRRIPTDAVGLCGGAETFDGLYAFYPEDLIKEPGFPFSIENATDLPAGARVEFFVLGGLDCELHDGTKVPEGIWAPFGEGEVSEDGSTISTDEGVGLPCLTWLAYRQKE